MISTNHTSPAVLGDDFLEELYAEPGGEQARSCAQCGMCAASCPSIGLMEYSPRKLIALLRAGRADKVLSSNTMWVCASCYLCAVRCPKEVNFPELMHALSHLTIRHGYATEAFRTSTMYSLFVDSVKRNGRVHELGLISSFYLRTNPFSGMKFLTMSLKMLRRVRISLRPARIKGIAQLQAIISRAEEVEEGKA